MVRPKRIRTPKSRPSPSDERRWAQRRSTLEKYAKIRQQEAMIS
jgi:hypothetical protein